MNINIAKRNKKINEFENGVKVDRFLDFENFSKILNFLTQIKKKWISTKSRQKTTL